PRCDPGRLTAGDDPGAGAVVGDLHATGDPSSRGAHRPSPWTVPPAVLVGLPADVLRRRPDVRRAERQPAAATAGLYPKLSLPASLGLASVTLTDLCPPASRMWSVGPTLNWPIFDAGRIRAHIAVQDARTEQQLSTYAQMVLTALEDVENALVASSR